MITAQRKAAPARPGLPVAGEGVGIWKSEVEEDLHGYMFRKPAIVFTVLTESLSRGLLFVPLKLSLLF